MRLERGPECTGDRTTGNDGIGMHRALRPEHTVIISKHVACLVSSQRPGSPLLSIFWNSAL